MMLDIGNKIYKNFVTHSDYIDIIREKISDEFAREVEKELDWVAKEEDLLEGEISRESRYMEGVNEELHNILLDAREVLGEYYSSIINGKRIERQKAIKIMEEVLDILDRGD